MSLLHPSGGLVYHGRAWRWRRRLWAPFHDQVRRWLTDWRPQEQHLVLLGPSGGYALSSQFLARFSRLTVLEPDPLARYVLARRFPEHRFVHREGGRFARPGGFAWLAATFPDAAFLFCNLLGQTPAGAVAAFDKGAWLAELAPALAGRAWASWHDLASTARPPDVHGPLALPAAAPLEAVLARYWRGGELEIHDHGCAGLSPDQPRQYVIWRLTPGRYHLVEWLASPPPVQAGASGLP